MGKPAEKGNTRNAGQHDEDGYRRQEVAEDRDERTVYHNVVGDHTVEGKLLSRSMAGGVDACSGEDEECNVGW